MVLVGGLGPAGGRRPRPTGPQPPGRQHQHRHPRRRRRATRSAAGSRVRRHERDQPPSPHGQRLDRGGPDGGRRGRCVPRCSRPDRDRRPAHVHRGPTRHRRCRRRRRGLRRARRRGAGRGAAGRLGRPGGPTRRGPCRRSARGADDGGDRRARPIGVPGRPVGSRGRHQRPDPSTALRHPRRGQPLVRDPEVAHRRSGRGGPGRHRPRKAVAGLGRRRRGAGLRRPGPPHPRLPQAPECAAPFARQTRPTDVQSASSFVGRRSPRSRAQSPTRWASSTALWPSSRSRSLAGPSSGDAAGGTARSDR